MISNLKLFNKDLSYAISVHEKEKLTIFGINPNRAETAFGYIKVDKNSSNKIKTFEKFIEKPDLKTVKSFFEMINIFGIQDLFYLIHQK